MYVDSYFQTLGSKPLDSEHMEDHRGQERGEVRAHKGGRARALRQPGPGRRRSQGRLVRLAPAQLGVECGPMPTERWLCLGIL